MKQLVTDKGDEDGGDDADADADCDDAEEDEQVASCFRHSDMFEAQYPIPPPPGSNLVLPSLILSRASQLTSSLALRGSQAGATSRLI